MDLTDVTTEELARRLGEPGLTVLDVRSEAEFSGAAGAPCDPRQGHILGALNLDVTELVGLAPAQRPTPAELLEPLPTAGVRGHEGVDVHGITLGSVEGAHRWIP